MVAGEREKQNAMKYTLPRLYDANNDLTKQWCVRYSFKDSESGDMVPVRVWISNRIKTKAGRRMKAQELINLIKSKLRTGWNPLSDAEIRLTSVSDAINFALKIKNQTLGTRAKQSYSSIANIFIEYLIKKKLSEIPIEDINYIIVQDFFDKSLVSEKIAPRTYNNRITALKTIFNFLIKRGYIQFNPFTMVEKLREAEPAITAYTKNELSSISTVLPTENFQLYVISQFIFYCFIRPAELVRLQFKDVFWDHSIILLPGSKSKNKKSEVIILPDQLKANLQHWRRDFPSEYYIFSKNLLPGIKEIAPTRIAEAWREFADRHGIKKVIYDFKHTGNGFAFDQGFNSRDIQLQNRHHSLDETQRYLNKFRRVASDRFKEKFSGY